MNIYVMLCITRACYRVSQDLEPLFVRTQLLVDILHIRTTPLWLKK